MPSFSDSRAPLVLVFDLDDTIYLERDFASSGFATIDAHLLTRYGEQYVSGTCQRLFEAGARGNIFDLALAQCGLDNGKEIVTELVDFYRNHKPSIAPCPDFHRFLARHEGKRAIITDGPSRMQWNKIAALGIETHFGLIVATGDLPPGRGKPHPMAFEQVMAWSGLAPEAHVYIADNPAKDFKAPRALGWQSVQIDRDGKIHPSIPPGADYAADSAITTLDDLAGILGLDC